MWNPVVTVSVGTFLKDVRIVGDFFRAQRRGRCFFCGGVQQSERDEGYNDD